MATRSLGTHSSSQSRSFLELKGLQGGTRTNQRRGIDLRSQWEPPRGVIGRRAVVGGAVTEAAGMLTFISSPFRQFSVTGRIRAKLRVKSRVKLAIFVFFLLLGRCLEASAKRGIECRGFCSPKDGKRRNIEGDAAK